MKQLVKARNDIWSNNRKCEWSVMETISNAETWSQNLTEMCIKLTREMEKASESTDSDGKRLKLLIKIENVPETVDHGENSTIRCSPGDKVVK